MNLSDALQSFQEIDYSDISSWPNVLKIIISFLFGLLILFAIYMLFYAPKLESYEAATAQEKILKHEFEEKQKLAANLPLYKEQMVEIKNRFDSVLRQLPDKSEVPALLKGISQAGVEQGLTFTRFKPSKPQQKNFYMKLPVAIEASGSYHQLSNFISAIANFQRIVSIGDFEITRKAEKDDVVNKPLNLKASIYTYHYSETEKLDDAEGAVSRVKK